MLKRIGFAALFISLTAAVALVLSLDGQARAQGVSETPTPSPGICGRSQKVQDAILDKLPDVSACGDVTNSDLSEITGTLDLSDMGVTTLPEDMFDGLANVELLSLHHNSLKALDENLFDGLHKLEQPVISHNQATELPEDTSLGELVY